MAAAYGTQTAVAYGSRTNTTINLPASVADGNHLLLCIVTANNGTAVTPSALSGWTRVGTDQTGTDGSFGYRVQMYDRIASSEPASYTVTHAATNSAAVMWRTTGSGTLSVDVFSQAVTATTGSTSTATSVSPTVTDALLYFAALNWDLVALTQPTGMTERLDSAFIYLASQTLSASGATGTRTQAHGNNPWFANLIAIKDDSAGGQTITGSLFSSAATFYGSTVTRGAVTVTGGLLTNSPTFYGATVSRGAVAVTAARYDNSNSFFGSTLAASYTVTGAIYINSGSFYQATVAPGAVTISGALYGNTQTFYGADAVASYTVTCALFTNAAVFYGSTVTAGSVTITGAMFTDVDTFYAATVSQGGSPQTVTAARLDNAQVFYSASVLPGSVSITGSRYDNATQFYNGIIVVDGGPQTIIASRADNASAFYGATIQPGSVTITAALFTDAGAFHAATVVPSYGISGALVVNNQVFRAATVSASSSPQTITAARYANDNVFYGSSISGGSPTLVASPIRAAAVDVESRFATVEKDDRIAVIQAESRVAA